MRGGDARGRTHNEGRNAENAQKKERTGGLKVGKGRRGDEHDGEFRADSRTTVLRYRGQEALLRWTLIKPGWIPGRRPGPKINDLGPEKSIPVAT